MRFFGLMLLAVFMHVKTAPAQNKKFTAFHPGEIWPDDKGVHINAHGGGILYQNGYDAEKLKYLIVQNLHKVYYK